MVLPVCIEIHVRGGVLRERVDVAKELFFAGGAQGGLLEGAIVRDTSREPTHELLELAQGVGARAHLEGLRVLLTDMVQPSRDIFAGGVDGLRPCSKRSDLREDPWVAHGGAPHHRGGTSSLFGDADGITRVPNVAVADDRDAELAREHTNDAPIRDAFIEVTAPARMNGDKVRACFFDDLGDGHDVLGVIEAGSDLRRELGSETEGVQCFAHFAEYSSEEFGVL